MLTEHSAAAATVASSRDDVSKADEVQMQISEVNNQSGGLGPVRADFSEAAVGICAHANGAKGFKGILKQVGCQIRLLSFRFLIYISIYCN